MTANNHSAEIGPTPTCRSSYNSITNFARSDRAAGHCCPCDGFIDMKDENFWNSLKRENSKELLLTSLLAVGQRMRIGGSMS